MSSTSPTKIDDKQQKPKRTICTGCNFPPRTCVCPSLPAQPLYPLLNKCRIIVLQHPHELRKKNRSMPLVELCLFGKGVQQSDTTKDDFVMKTVTMRRFGEYTDASVMNILRDPNEVIVLVFPHKNAMDLEEGIQLAEKRCEYDSIDNDTEEQKQQKKMTLIFIDATWKHAREMEQASSVEWPKNLIRVQLKPSKSNVKEGGSDQSSNIEVNSKEGPAFVERRFQIRTPPSPDHLSTAECLAWIVSRVENNPRIYQSITKALDYMVAIWQQVREEAASSNTRKKKKNKATNRPDDMMSQKKLKIGKS